jgi:LCP family protein required for cell wall assembly
VPPLFVLVLLAYEIRRGPFVFATELFADRRTGLAAVAIVALLGAWRLAAVVHTYWGGRHAGDRRTLDKLVVGALAVVIVVSHTGASYVLAAYSNAGVAVFTPNPTLVDLTTPVPTIAYGPTPSATSTPEPTATVVASTTSISRRVTILFTGVDSAAGRVEHLYDSIMVVSYDPKTNSIQMVSVPRDSASFPMYFGGQVSSATRINSIPTYVQNGWIKSPDSPYMTLVKEVSYLVGIPIDYYAVMDFTGFVKMIDMVGGIDLNVQTAIDDPSYNWDNGGRAGFKLAAGPQHLDGVHALAFVRSRHGSSDWARSSRQQQVLVALLHRMTQPDALSNILGLISTLGQSLTTNFPADQVADFVAVGEAVPSSSISQVVLGPPYSITGINTLGSASTNCLLNDKVAGLSIYLFGKDSLWYGKRTPANTCPVAAPPSPTATSTPVPTAAPTEAPTPEPTPAPTAS